MPFMCWCLASASSARWSLRLLQNDEAGLNDMAGKQPDEYLYAWVRGYVPRQPAAGMRRASSAGRQGNSAGTCQTDAMQVEPAPLTVPLPQAPAQSSRKRKAPMSVSDLARHGYK